MRLRGRRRRLGGGGEVEAVAEEGEGGKSADGTTAQTRERLPGEGLERLVEDEKGVLVDGGGTFRGGFGAVKLFESFAEIDNDLQRKWLETDKGTGKGGLRRTWSTSISS